jgi:hypothetical protein
MDFSPAVVFKMAATMCERGSSTATNTMKTEVYLEPVVDNEQDTVQELLAVAACVNTIPAKPAIERSSISPRVVVVDNSQGIFQLIGPKEKVYVPRRVLLDSGAQPLMLGPSAIAGLKLTKDTLEECPWTISTSMGGTERATGITKVELSLKLNQEDVKDACFMKVKAIVMEAKSYDVLVETTVLYPMGFTLDFKEKIASYRPGWQAGNRRKVQLPAQFIRVLTGNIADLYAFSGYVDVDLSLNKEDFDGNAFATHMEGEDPMTVRGLESIKVYQPGVEVAWNTTSQLREAANLVIQEAWQESLLPRVEEEVNGKADLGRPPLDNSTIHWRPLEDGIVLLELFGRIGSGLVAVLQVGLKVKRYIYVDMDEAARQVAKRHSRRLRTQFPELLATSAIKISFSTLEGDIALVSAENIHRCGHVDLVLAGWPCQGMSMAGKQNGLQDGRSSRFHDMIRVMRYLQTSQRRPLGYIVENMPVMSSSRSRTLESMHKIHNILGVPVLIDVATVSLSDSINHFNG